MQDIGDRISELCRTSHVDPEEVVGQLQVAVAEAASEAYGLELECEYDPDEDELRIFRLFAVVEDSRPTAPSSREIARSDARRYGLDSEPGDELLFDLHYRDEDRALLRDQNSSFAVLIGAVSDAIQFEERLDEVLARTLDALRVNAEGSEAATVRSQPQSEDARPLLSPQTDPSGRDEWRVGTAEFAAPWLRASRRAPALRSGAHRMDRARRPLHRRRCGSSAATSRHGRPTGSNRAGPSRGSTRRWRLGSSRPRSTPTRSVAT